MNNLILLAEDDEDDYLILRDAFGECPLDVELARVRDGEELLEYLEKAPLLPSIILLDLNMPRKDGREALKEIKSNEKWRHIPVVALTTSNMQSDVRHVYQLGAANFIRKPSSYSEMLRAIAAFQDYWFKVSLLP